MSAEKLLKERERMGAKPMYVYIVMRETTSNVFFTVSPTNTSYTIKGVYANADDAMDFCDGMKKDGAKYIVERMDVR